MRQPYTHGSLRVCGDPLSLLFPYQSEVRAKAISPLGRGFWRKRARIPTLVAAITYSTTIQANQYHQGKPRLQNSPKGTQIVHRYTSWRRRNQLHYCTGKELTYEAQAERRDTLAVSPREEFLQRLPTPIFPIRAHKAVDRGVC